MIERILLLMEQKGVKASELTEAVGLNHSSITEWKKSKSKPGTDAVIKIADYFGVSTDYILTGRNNESQSKNTKESFFMSKRYFDEHLGVRALQECFDGYFVRKQTEDFMLYTDYSEPLWPALVKLSEDSDIDMERIKGFCEILANNGGSREKYPDKIELHKIMLLRNKLDGFARQFYNVLAEENILLEEISKKGARNA